MSDSERLAEIRAQVAEGYAVPPLTQADEDRKYLLDRLATAETARAAGAQYTVHNERDWERLRAVL